MFLLWHSLYSPSAHGLHPPLLSSFSYKPFFCIQKKKEEWGRKERKIVTMNSPVKHLNDLSYLKLIYICLFVIAVSIVVAQECLFHFWNVETHDSLIVFNDSF